MVCQKKRRMKGTDTEQGEVKALRQEVEELREERARSREENEGLKLRIAKLGAESQTPQEEEKEVRLPTEVWAIIAGKLNENDVCSFALVSKQLREAQVRAGRKLVTRPAYVPHDDDYGYLDHERLTPCVTQENFNFTLSPLSSDVSDDDDDDDDDDYEGGGGVGCPWSVVQRESVKVMSIYRFHPFDIEQYGNTYGVFLVSYFTEGWCAYWSRKFNEDHTDPKIVKRVLYVAARHGYLQVFEKYWSQGPQEKLSKLWGERTCGFAANGGRLEVLQWLRAKGCPWGTWVSCGAAFGGQLEVLQWMRAQYPPCPWNSDVCSFAALGGHLEVLRWARSQGCSWDERVPTAAAKNGHLKVLIWLIKEGCPYDKSWCRGAAVKGGERTRKVLEWLDE